MANLLSTNVSGRLYVSSQSDVNPTGGAFRFYDGSTFRGGLGLDDWAHAGSAANITMYVSGDNNFFISTSGVKRAQFNSGAAIFRTYSPDTNYNIRVTGGDQFNAYYGDNATTMYVNWNGGTTRFGGEGRFNSSLYSSGYVWAENASIRIGEIWGYGGLYRSSGSIVIGVEGSAGWSFRAGNSEKVWIGNDGNIYMAWAGAYISTLLDAKQNASTAITTSNIGSQSVNYASSAGNADTVDGRHADYFYPGSTDNGYSTGDIYGSGTHQRLWGTDSVQNILAFRPPTSIEYSTDGTNWTATTATNGLWDNKIFGKWGGFTMAVGNNIGAWRFVRMTWVNFGYHFFSHFTLAHSTNGHSFNFVFQKSDLNGVFSGEAFRQNGINSWPGYTFTKHSNVSGWWDTRDIRFVFELNHNNDFPNNGISIGHIGLMGGYSSFTRLYDWDADRNMFFGNIVYAAGGNSSQWNTAFGWGNHASAGYQAASTAITTSNIGSQSVNYATSAGNSDTLDSLDSSEFARGRAAYQALNLDTIKQPGLYQYDGGIGGTQPEGADQANLRTIEIGSGGRYSQMAFDWASEQAWFRRQTGDTWSAWREFIHSGNIGSQSVSYATSAGNADTVDGYHATNAAGGLAVINANGYWYPPSWINVGGAGIYSGTNDAHLLPNNTSPHGAWEMIGSKGGWSGIYFRDSGNTLMANANDSGFYNANAGWQIEWYNGTLSVSKQANGGGTLATVLDSSNFTSWAQTKVYQGQNDGDWQNFTNDVGEFRVDEVLNITSGNHSNYPTGVYTYGGVMSWRGNNHSFQLYASHTGDLTFKTQWGNDNHSGWRNIIHSANIGSQSVNYASSAGNADTVDGYHESAFWRNDQNRVIGVLRFTGEGGDSGNGNIATSYGIYQQGGAWTYPYPDLCIGFHTGIKIGAHYSYGGTRFYNNSDWVTEIFSVGNGDNHVRVENNLYVGNTIYNNGNAVIHAGNIGSQSVNYASSAGNVAWTGVTAGRRTNYDLGFEAPSAGYAGFSFTTPGGAAENAGYFLIRGGADSDVYTQNGITLVADAGWLSLAQRTTAGKGVRIMSGTTSTTRMSFNADGTTYLYTDLYLGSTNTRITATDASGYVRLYGSAGNYLALGPYNNNGWVYFENSANASGIYFNSPGRYAFDSVDVTPYNDNENSLGNGSYRWANVYTAGWFRNYGAQGIYNESYGTHFYSNAGNTWVVTGSGGTVSLEFRSNHQSTIRGYVYADTSNNIGFLNNAGNWSLLTNSSRNTILYGQLTVGEGIGYSSIFMTDSDEGTREIHCNSNRIGFLTQAGAWGAWLYDSADWEAASSVRAPIFYDSNDTTYYLDPNADLSLRVYGEICNSNYAEGKMQPGALNIGRTDTNYAWDGGSWAGDVRLGILANTSETWEFGIHDSGDSVMSVVHFDGGSTLTMGRNLGWGQCVVNAPAGYVSNSNPWGTANSAYFPNGITTAGGTNWIYGFTYIGNAPGNGNGHEFNANGTQYSTTSITTPTFIVNNHSDNTRGYRIHNTSGTAVSAMFVNSSNQLVIAAGAVDQINLNKKVYVNGVALGVNVAPSATAGRIDASNDIVAYSSSDERLKENITPIENALDKVKSLTGVEFDWKPEYKHAHGYEGHDTGIIAQQVEAVIPSAVRTNDTGFLAVRYEKLIGLLIEGMKEQQAQIDELKAKLDGLTK